MTDTDLLEQVRQTADSMTRLELGSAEALAHCRRQQRAAQRRAHLILLYGACMVCGTAYESTDGPCVKCGGMSVENGPGGGVY